MLSIMMDTIAKEYKAAKTESDRLYDKWFAGRNDSDYIEYKESYVKAYCLRGLWDDASARIRDGKNVSLEWVNNYKTEMKAIFGVDL